MKMLFPTSAAGSSSFDDFFNEEMYRQDGSDDENAGQLDQYDDFFRHDTLTKDEYRLPSLDTTAKAQPSPPQPWRQGVWCMKQRQQPSPLVVEKTRRVETKQRPDALQTMNTGHHYVHTAQGPLSPIDVTSRGRTKRFATSPHTSGLDHAAANIRPPFSREATLSPSPMYPHFPMSPQSGHGAMSNWQQDFQNFHLQLPYEPPLQAPPATTREQHGRSARELNSAVVAQNQGLDLPKAWDHYESTEAHFSPAIDPFLVNPQGHQDQNAASAYHQDLDLRYQPAITLAPVSLPSPTSISPPSSGSSNHSRQAQTDISECSTNVSLHSQAQFSPHTATSHPPLPTLEPEETYPALAAPKPQRVPHPILHQPNDSSLTGLGIQYPELEQMSQAVLYEPPTYYPQVSGPVGVAVPYPPTTLGMPGSLSSYPPLPPPPSYVFSDASPFTTPRKQRRSPARSPSPPVSPTTNVSPRRNPGRSPMRIVTEYSHSRRKSLHRAGPMKDTAGPEAVPVPRTRSSSRPPRTPKASRTPTSGTATIDFVNFTPKDSAKLLNDVAPSGSSKTRARRELEAREKRKKLNEAALKAVKVAGGDVAVFEKAIFA